METVPAPSTGPGPLRQRTTPGGGSGPEEPRSTETEGTPLVAPLAVVGVGMPRSDLVGSACTFDAAFRSGPGALGAGGVGPGPPR